MTFRTLSLLGVSLMLGCGSEGGTVTNFDEDTGSGFPSETGDETTTDTSAPPTDSSAETTPVVDTGTPPTDTPVDTPASGTPVKCGSFTCTAAQECCIIGGVGACLAAGAVCAGSRYTCTSTSNCKSGQVCCISGSGAGGASCAAAGSCPSTTTCDTNADCTGSAKTCVDIGGGIKACRK